MVSELLATADGGAGQPVRGIVLLLVGRCQPAPAAVVTAGPTTAAAGPSREVSEGAGFLLHKQRRQSPGTICSGPSRGAGGPGAGGSGVVASGGGRGMVATAAPVPAATVPLLHVIQLRLTISHTLRSHPFLLPRAMTW